MRPIGKTNLIAIVVIGAVAYGIWRIFTFSGVYLDNLNVIGLGLKPENVTITRDEVRKTIGIVVEYQRKVFLMPTAKIKFVKFKVVKEGVVPVMGQ